MVQPKRHAAPAQLPQQQRMTPNGVLPHMHGDVHMPAGASATLRMDAKRSGPLKGPPPEDPMGLVDPTYRFTGSQLTRQNSWDLPPPLPPHNPPTQEPLPNNHRAPSHSPAPTNGTAPPTNNAQPPQEPAKETEAQKRAREDELVSRAEGLRREHTTLALAYDRPNPEPARCVDHQGALLKEMRFLALDFSQERLWKQAAARALAYAAVEHRPALRHVACPAAKEMGEAVAAEAKALLAERQASGKSAGPSGALHESRQSSAASTLTWAPLDAVRFASVFAAHIQELADNRFIKQEQAIRDYDDEFEAARKAVAEAAELAQNRDAGAAPMAIDEEELPVGKKGRQKKGRLPKHLDDFAGVSPVPMPAQPPSPTRTAPLPPTRSQARSAGTPAPEPMAVDEEERPLSLRRTDRKKRRRDYDDEDYEEPRLRDRRRPPPEPVARRPPAAATNLRDRKLRANTRSVSRDTYANNQVASRARTQVVPPPWSATEDALLSAIVFEFGANWSLVSDIFSSTTALAGIFRRPEACRERFRQHMGADDKVVNGKQEQELVFKRMDKGQARQVLLRALPVPEAALQATQKQVLGIMLNHQHKRAAEEKRAWESSRGRGETHPTHVQVQQAALANAGGRFLGPTDLADLSDAHHAAQHAAAQQAAQAAHAHAAQQQAAQQVATVQQQQLHPPQQHPPTPQPQPHPQQQHQLVPTAGLPTAPATTQQPAQSQQQAPAQPPGIPPRPSLPMISQQQAAIGAPHPSQFPTPAPRPSGAMTPPPVASLHAQIGQLPLHLHPPGMHGGSMGAPAGAPGGLVGAGLPQLPPGVSAADKVGSAQNPAISSVGLPQSHEQQQQQQPPQTQQPQSSSVVGSMGLSQGVPQQGLPGMPTGVSGVPAGVPGVPTGIPGMPSVPGLQPGRPAMSLPQGLPPAGALSMPGGMAGAFSMAPGVRGPAAARPGYTQAPLGSAATAQNPNPAAQRPMLPHPNITPQQIQQILSAGKLPDGRDLVPQIRQALVARLKQTQAYAVASAAAPRGVAPGAPGNARPPAVPLGSMPQAQALVRGQLPQGVSQAGLPSPGAPQGLQRPQIPGVPAGGYPRPPGSMPGLPPGFPGMMAGLNSMAPQMQAQMAQMRPNMLASYASQQPPAISGAPPRPPGGS